MVWRPWLGAGAMLGFGAGQRFGRPGIGVVEFEMLMRCAWDGQYWSNARERLGWVWEVLAVKVTWQA